MTEIEVLSLADLYNLPLRSEKDEREYRRGYCDGWIEATNIMFGLWFLRDKQRIYDVMFAHYETDLYKWMNRSAPLSCFEIPPRPKGAICVYCGALADTTDHVIPRSHGGTDDDNNLVPACRRCNMEKGAKSLQEWIPPNKRMKPIDSPS